MLGRRLGGHFSIGILVLILPTIGAAASQLAPFFEGLKAAQGIEQRRAYLKSEYRASNTLMISEELPVLIGALKGDDPLVSYLAGEYVHALATQHLADVTFRDQLQSAAPALVAHFNDPDPKELLTESGSLIRQWHRFVLGYLQYVSLPVPLDLIPSVEAALYDPQWGFLAVRELVELNPMPPRVVDALLARASEPIDAQMKGDIVNGLAGKGVRDPRVIQIVMGMLAGSDREQQRLAAGAAVALGSAGKDSIPYLRAMLLASDLNDQTRRDVGWALKQLEPAKPDDSPSIPVDQYSRNARAADPPAPTPMSIRAYFDLLKAAKPQERQRVVKDFRAVPNGQSMAPSEDVPFLIEVMSGGDADLAEYAASFLVLMANEYRGAGTNVKKVIETALPSMEVHFDDPTPDRPLDFVNRHRWRMIVIRFVLVTGATPTEDLLAKMLKAIDDENSYTAVLATAVLAQMNPIPPRVLDAVLTKMNDRSPEMRRAVMDGLAANRNNDRRFIEALAANLDNPVVDHQGAAKALAELGSFAKAAEPALRRLISREASENTPEGYAQQSARIALGKMSSP